MVMRGHMVESRKENFSHMISLDAQLSFDIHHASYYLFLRSKVQEGHERSNHCHERSYDEEQKRMVVTNGILGYF